MAQKRRESKMSGFLTKGIDTIKVIDDHLSKMGMRVNYYFNVKTDLHEYELYDKNVSMGIIKLGTLEGHMRSVTRRTTQLHEFPQKTTIKVFWLIIYDEYGGKGYGILLLIYGICKMYELTYDTTDPIDIITLEDDSDKNDDGRSIYYQIGLTPHKATSLILLPDGKPSGKFHMGENDGERRGTLEWFFLFAIPKFIKRLPEIGRVKSGGKSVRFKTYRRKGYSRNKKNKKSRKHR